MIPVPPDPTSEAQADQAIARLTERKSAWATVGIPERIVYLQRCLEDVLRVAEDWAIAASRAKGIALESSLVGEEWLAGPVAVLAYLRSLLNSLPTGGRPPRSLTRRADGQLVAHVFPDSWQERILWAGFRGEVWIEPGQPATQGRIYREFTPGQLALVLGAGNISAIAPLDSLYKLFTENQVVLLKLNPVNEYLGEWVQAGLRSLIQDGFLQLVYGGAELGSYLCQHPKIDHIHITGSQATHDAIVWGGIPTPRQSATPITKPITSELGCVTPVLVVPGDWSAADLAFQARQVASAVAHNASFNCAAAKVLVLARDWPQRSQFLQQVRHQLVAIPLRYAYYPGSQQRYEAFLQRYPQAEVLGANQAGAKDDRAIPWTLIPDVPAIAGEYALTTEAFCGVLAEVSLAATNASEFLTSAVEFVNDQVAGSLSCTLLIDPATRRRYATEYDRAIAQLRYGSISVNAWSGVGYAIAPLTWGAFPGNSLAAIGSGRGVVHNTSLFDYPQKSVLSAPFRIRPTPLWFADRPHLKQVAEQLATLYAEPNWKTLVSVIAASVRRERSQFERSRAQL